MKQINFTKMAGSGNDFLIINAQNKLDYQALSKKACDRFTGIGADGVVILDKSKKSDYRMRIINPDGSEAEMCGNGVRCLAAYIARNKKPRKKLFSIETLAGTIICEAKDEYAKVRLSAPKDYIPFIALDIKGEPLSASFINTGVPHAVIFVNGLKKFPVFEYGRIIRYHEKFQPKGTNVNFIEQLKKDTIAIRTYERGVEGETRACGTGSVASAIIAYFKLNPAVKNKANAQISVKTQSGEILKISFDIKDTRAENVWLSGSSKFIAEGKYFI
ncbi:MAG: diaminopimelate epimerase [Candidatus Omnitrophica bacterium]|nr:diaminopimelate epimerase [Candidatus Omnitrophota bacterium]